ncbi:hypothetical protein BDN70DRAFT_935942 [Pholiota conissans]|uniref:Uncharacterized protein n=1 Tax=Pholiota conissans TaxID=109636 RepID=A0A9P5YT38_9AGAR|nr:hypothetical protein BDN70DRAFT_935942 [Pholiota conissans]
MSSTTVLEKPQLHSSKFSCDSTGKVDRIADMNFDPEFVSLCFSLKAGLDAMKKSMVNFDFAADYELHADARTLHLATLEKRNSRVMAFGETDDKGCIIPVGVSLVFFGLPAICDPDTIIFSSCAESKQKFVLEMKYAGFTWRRDVLEDFLEVYPGEGHVTKKILLELIVQEVYYNLNDFSIFENLSIAYINQAEDGVWTLQHGLIDARWAPRQM